jgi:hypothetical protein
MTATNGDIRSPARREKLRRVALWALLGAASGAVAWVVIWAVGAWDWPVCAFSCENVNELLLLIPIILPGLTFGAAAGLALFGLGYARLWQAVLFAVLSVPAWYAGVFAEFEYGPHNWASGLYSEYLRYFVSGVVGGTAWAIVQTLAVAVLPFARRARLLVTLVAVGAVAAGLLWVAGQFVGVGFFDDSPVLILLTGWYAVYAAVLSLFLPWPKSEA